MSKHISAKDNHQKNTIRDGVVRARVNNVLKRDVEKILDRLGITVSEAISMYLSQIKLSKGIPFGIKIPNKTTIKTFKETDKNRSFVKAENIREIFEKAGL